MNNPQAVQLIDSRAYLFHQPCSLPFTHRLILPQHMKKLSSCHHFQNHIDILLIIETAIHLNNMRMIQQHLYLDLPRKLLHYVLLSDQRLLHHLQRTTKTTLLISEYNKTYRTRYTLPYFPFPNVFIISKSSSSLVPLRPRLYCFSQSLLLSLLFYLLTSGCKTVCFL